MSKPSGDIVRELQMVDVVLATMNTLIANLTVKIYHRDSCVESCLYDCLSLTKIPMLLLNMKLLFDEMMLFQEG